MIHVLGIDAGGSKTVCRLADEQQTTLAEVRGGGANLQADGEAAVELVLRQVMEAALDGHAVTLAAICLGMAGVDRPGDARTVRNLVSRLGYEARVLVVNDALVALEAGVGGDPGVVIVAGTGSIVYGRNAAGLAARAGGWGYVLGDEGSGHWMGRLALRAVAREADGRGRATSLTPRVLDHFGVGGPRDLVPALYGEGQRPGVIAELAKVVGAAADEGDAIALQIVESGGQALVAGAETVAGRLGLLDEVCTFVLSGGMFKGVPRLADEVTRGLVGLSPRAEVRSLEVEPAAGAVRLALAEAIGGASVPRYLGR
jgi:N-acetylglucosamine kinase-like BadF-type ATPase